MSLGPRFPRDEGGHDLNVGVPSLFGQNMELDFNLDLTLKDGVIKIVKSGLHKNIVALSPDVTWSVSLWPVGYSPSESKKLGLPNAEIQLLSQQVAGSFNQVENKFEQDGNFVLQISASMNGKEIQTIGKKVAVKNGKIVEVASVSEEEIAQRGDLSEAHLEE